LGSSLTYITVNLLYRPDSSRADVLLGVIETFAEMSEELVEITPEAGGGWGVRLWEGISEYVWLC